MAYTVPNQAQSQPKNQLVKMDFKTAMQTTEFQEKITDSLVDPRRIERFKGSILTYVNNTPALADCEPMSILTAALTGETLGLSPSPQLGQYYMVPRQGKNDPAPKATFQIGYRGLVQLALRTGQYRTINCIGIKPGELVSWNPLTEEIELRFNQNWAKRESMDSVGYVAYIEYLNGFRKTVFWPRSQVEAHRDRYNKQSKPGSVWVANFEAMARKTVLSAALRQCELTTDSPIAQAMDSDMAYEYQEYQEDVAPDPAPAQTQAAPQGEVIEAEFTEVHNDDSEDVTEDPF